MSDDLRKGVGDQVQEKLTPDSQKSTTEQATEKATTAGDKVAGSLQPGDSKSTAQKLSDESRSGFDSAQDTAKSYGNQASEFASNAQSKISENLPSSGEAQDTTKSYANQASDLATNASNKISESLPSSGEAQDTGKSLLDQASELASNAAKTVSDTFSESSSRRPTTSLVAMAKDKDRALNPAAAQRKADKQKALKKGKAAVQAQRNERLAHRNPARLERQIADLKTLQSSSPQGGGLSARDKKQLEDLERELGRVKKAREALGGKAPSFSAAGEKRNLHTGSSSASDGEETDESVRRIPMPRDTPPPIPRTPGTGSKRRRGEGNAHPNANLEPLGKEGRVQHELPKKPEAPAPRTTYEAKPVVRDLRKEAVKAFVPATVARKAAAAKGGVGERLLEEEEVQKLEKEGYVGGRGKGNGASAGGIVVDAAPAVDGGGGEDEQSRSDEEAERFSREVRMEEVSDEDL
ncbi:MAG: hypothetical protein LQ342_002822 [Letrouitia transgressa]|nr:MAG: hypothetical protein LQ342_002822 [Letrouitia transgressa]